MADTIREQVIAAFTARAQALSTNTVERTRRQHPEGNEINISVWDGEDEAIGKKFGIQELSFPIALQIQWRPDINPSIAANAMMGDVVKVMLSTDSTFNGLAKSMDYLSSTPEYPADGSGYISLAIIFNIYYATQLGNPFAAI